MSPGTATATEKPMHSINEGYKAATAIIRSLAKGDAQSFDEGFPISIPGEDSPEKLDLERELKALVYRIRHLETRAASTNNHILPETPNEAAAPSSPFSSALLGSNRHPSPIPSKGVVYDLFGEDGPGSDASERTQLEYLQAKCKSHEQEILENRRELRDIMLEMERVKMTPQVPINEATKIDRLQKELKKSQQANEAFSKSLREIGEIVTAVARGDLTKK